MNESLGVSELEHVLLLAEDLGAARDFYERVLGLRVGPRPAFPFDGHWLYAGDRPCLHLADRASYRRHARSVGLAVGDRPAPAGCGPVDHIAFRGTDPEALGRRLADAGITPVRNEVPGGGPRQLFFDDPDGLRVEVNFPPAPKGGP